MMIGKRKSFIVTLCCICFILFAAVFAVGNVQNLQTAYASRSSQGTNTDDEWTGTQTTRNLITIGPSDGETYDVMKDYDKTLEEQGWHINGDVYAHSRHYLHKEVHLETEEFGWGIQAVKNKDIGNTDYSNGVWYQITLSDADRAKADKGDLKVSASSLNYRQEIAGCTQRISLQLFFYNENNGQIGQVTRQEDVKTGKTYPLKIENETVPQNTAFIRYYVSNSNGSFYDARAFIGGLVCTLTDNIAPDVETMTLDKSGIIDVENNVAIEGNTLKYYVEFDEKISVDSYGKATLALNGQEFASTSNGEMVTENGKSRVIYTIILPSGNESGTVSLKSVSGLTVKDESGNVFTYDNTSPDLDTVQYYKTMSVTTNLTNLTTEGAETAKYGTNYTATLIANAGYELPQSVEITVDGSPIAENGYLYNSADGKITIYGAYIKGDISIKAAGTAKKSAVTLDMQNGSDGTNSVTAEYAAQLPDITAPSRTGYAFAGYFSKSGGNGTKYYDAAGKGVINCDFYKPITLYAHWTANEYTITYNPNKPTGASGSITGTTENSEHIYDTERSLSANGYILQGWTFQGWSTTANGAVEYPDKAAVKNLTETAGKEVILYAVWKANSYTITLNSAGGSNSGSVQATFDSILPVISAIPARHGYNFLGYFDAQTGGMQYYGADGKAVQDKTFTTDSNIVLYAQWTPVTYTVELYSEGNYVASIYDVTFGRLYLPSAQQYGLARSNFDFVGWNMYDEQNWAMYLADTSYSVGLTGEQNGVVVLYAAWSEKPIYTINYDANGGAGAPAMIQAHEDETIQLSAVVPTRKNYAFLGWATTADAEIAQYLSGENFTMGSTIVTLYAVWKHNPSLTYDANGGAFNGTPEILYPAAGETIVIPSLVPEREGHVFAGWSANQNAESADYTPGSEYRMPDTNVVFYAVWKNAQYTVTRTVPDGYGIVGLENQYYFEDTAIFSVSGAAPKVYINGQLAYAGENGQYAFVVKGNTHVFVADGSKLSLIYSANGGTGAPVDQNTYQPDGKATVSETEPSRVGYTFAGWAIDPDATEAKYTSGKTVPFSDGDIILYAVWKANAYTVIYDANGGTGTMNPDEFTYGTEKALSKNTFEKTGHTFIGWALSAEGKAVYDDGAAVFNLCTENDGEITLYAIWEQTITVITFAPSDDCTEINAPLSIAYGESLSSDGLVAPVRGGYRFAGYYTQPNDAGEIIFDNELNMVYANAWDKNVLELTLYSHWSPITYTVVYISGSEISSEQQAIYGTPFDLKSATSLNIVAPNGYHFAGWTTAPSGQIALYADGQTISEALTQTDNGEVFLYAVFEADERFTVTYYANGGSNAPVDGNRYITGDTVTLPDIIPERDGYIFSGWSYNPNNSPIDFPYENDRFTTDSVAMTEGGISLYAVWTAGETLQSQIDSLEKNADELSEAIAALEKADGSFKTELDELGTALKAAQAAIESLDNSFATDAELGAAVTDLTGLLAKAEKRLNDEISNVKGNLDAAVSRLEVLIGGNTGNIEALNDALTALETAYKNADTVINGKISDLENKDEELAESINTLKTAYEEADAALQKSVDGIKNKLESEVQRLEGLITSNGGEIDGLKTALDSLSTAYEKTAALINSEIPALKDKDTELGKSIVALDQAYKSADKALQASIEGVKSKLNAEVARLEGLIESGSGNISELEKAIADLNTAYKAADALINSQIADLKTRDEAIRTSIATLESAYKTADDALWAGIRKVQDNLDALQAKNDNASLIYMIINIALAGVAVILIVTLIIKAVKRRKTEK